MRPAEDDPRSQTKVEEGWSVNNKNALPITTSTTAQLIKTASAKCPSADNMTSSNASHISSPKYGYDFVVATTQASINAAMMNFLSTRKEPTVNVCYIADDEGNPVRIDYTELKKRANGSDPFKVPNRVSPSGNADFRNLYGARFMMGFSARLGLPRVAQPSLLPDIVVLESDTASV